MEDLIGKTVSLQVTGVVTSYTVEGEDSYVVKNNFGNTLVIKSELRKRVVIAKSDGGEVVVDTTGQVELTPLVN